MSSEPRENQGQESGGDRRGQCEPIKCFTCGEEGHYANQCRNPKSGWRGARASTSSNSRGYRSYSSRKQYRGSSSEDREVQSQIKEFGRNLESMREFIEAQQAAKEEQLRRKNEKKEVENREREAAEVRAKKVGKKAEKTRLEEERVAAMKKDMDVHVKLSVKEAMKEAWRDSDLRDALMAAKVGEKKKGKQKVSFTSDNEFSEYEYVSSGTEEIREHTGNLSINEKRKRGPEPVFEDSPPMELPPKHTPKRTLKRGTTKTLKMTPIGARSKKKTKVRLSPAIKEKLASAVKVKIPTSIGTVGRYKFREAVMKQIKHHDAITLQNLCIDAGIPYNGKVEAIFDLADHQADIAYGPEGEDPEDTNEPMDDDAVGTSKNVDEAEVDEN
ncbi:hypothetical protein CBR_g29283 [Chara braunii]|uniref:CCHC-type domain-containing protein n=1 Tax=Chara braunii TaxID=69332 RepID=A0A388LA85_CHABU|nr:hypothetical protein CBR_g29283 [Chara braunii]|eukprot:GBG79231.1 hypothetical protein CBR_g29283 [Chara braunii]